MKILMVTHGLILRAGSERYTYEVAKELKSRGHEVTVYTPAVGEFADTFKKDKIKVLDNPDELKKYEFDVIHAQHNLTALIARSIFPKTPMIFLSHGVLPELEQPPSINLGINRYVAVSDEVKENLVKNHNIPEKDVEVIRNFVDIERFKPESPIPETPTSLLVISNHLDSAVRKVIEESCKQLELTFNHIGLPNNSVEDVENYINRSDIIITLGKGVLEAMACERNVVVYDEHGGDGFVDLQSYKEIRKNNFSGRRYAKEYKTEDLVNELKKYDEKLGPKLRELVKKEHTVQYTVDKLLNVYKEASKGDLKSQIGENDLLFEILFIYQFYPQVQGMNFKVAKMNNEIGMLHKELEGAREEIASLADSIGELQVKNREKDEMISYLSHQIDLRKTYFGLTKIKIRNLISRFR